MAPPMFVLVVGVPLNLIGEHWPLFDPDSFGNLGEWLAATAAGTAVLYAATESRRQAGRYREEVEKSDQRHREAIVKQEEHHRETLANSVAIFERELNERASRHSEELEQWKQTSERARRSAELLLELELDSHVRLLREQLSYRMQIDQGLTELALARTALISTVSSYISVEGEGVNLLEIALDLYRLNGASRLMLLDRESEGIRRADVDALRDEVEELAHRLTRER